MPSSSVGSLPPPPSTDPPTAGGRHVAALDGLRGVAVAAVVAYHVRPDWVPGGFLGVDLFFVLSGFLITSLLLEEREATGGLDLRAFAGRRLRRLLPAVVLVVLVVTVDAVLGGDAARIEQIRRHGLATLAYVANWVFIADGDSYFADVVEPSTLRHVWSLAIEEQFYLVWPALLWLAARTGGRRAVGGLAVVLAAASAAWMAARYDGGDPSRAYFGTDTRAFEPIVGAAVATVLPLRGPIPRTAPAWGLGALGVWLAATVVVDDAWTGFYEGGALVLAVVAAAAIVGSLRPGPLATALSWRPLVALGAISYGVYLWHWPLLLIVRRRDLADPVADLLVVGLTLAVAAASYRLVEEPIRRGRGMGRFVVGGWRPVVAAVLTIAVVGGAVVAATRTEPREGEVTVADVIAELDGPPAGEGAAEGTTEGEREGRGEGGAAGGDVGVEPPPTTAAAPAATDPPATDPSVGPGPVESGPVEPITVALVGDSSAWTLGGGEIGLRTDHGPYVSPFDPERVVLLNLARKGYRLVPGATTDLGGVRARSGDDLESERWWREVIADVEPDLVVAMFGLSDLQSREIDGVDVPFGSAVFDDRFRAAADGLLGDLAATAPVLLLTSPPLLGEEMPVEEMAAFFDARSASRARHLNGLLAEVAAASPRIDLHDLAGWLCPEGGVDGEPCRRRPDGGPMRFDGVHYDEEGGAVVAAYLTEHLIAAAAGGDGPPLG